MFLKADPMMYGFFWGGGDSSRRFCCIIFYSGVFFWFSSDHQRPSCHEHGCSVLRPIDAEQPLHLFDFLSEGGQFLTDGAIVSPRCGLDRVQTRCNNVLRREISHCHIFAPNFARVNGMHFFRTVRARHFF